MKRLGLHDVVVLRRKLPEHGLEPGRIGAVVLVHERPSLAYEVEFVDEQGRTVALVALAPGDIELSPEKR